MSKSLTLRSGKKLAKKLIKHAQRYLEHDFETVPQEEERILGDRNTHLVNIIMHEISEYNKLVEELKARPVFINRDPIVDVGSVFRKSGTDFVNLAKRQIINRPGAATRSRIRIQNSIYNSNKKFVTKNKSRKSRNSRS
jgi:hypothetical protein